MLFEVGAGLLTLGVLVVLFVAYDLWGTAIAEHHSQSTLARQFRTEVAQASRAAGRPASRAGTGHRPSGVAGASGPGAKSAASGARGGRSGTGHVAVATRRGPTVLVPPAGGAIDHIVIPAIGVERYVVQGVAEADLQMGPGHYPGTPLPGQRGNVGIAGHRTTFGAPFFELNALRPGDFVYLTDTSRTTWVYRVQRQWVVAPTDVGVLNPTPGSELTLTTCNPRFEATSRLVVRAALAGRLAPGAHLAPGLPVAAAGSPGASAAANRSHPRATSTSTPVTTGAPAGGAASSPGHTGGSTHDPVVSLPAAAGPSPLVEASGAKSVAASTAGAWSWVGAAAWGLLALAVWVTARVLGARRRRWGKAAVLVPGAAVALVPVWFVFENLVRLLPANL